MASSIDLHPPIHWGQTSSTVSLRIGLTDVKYPKVEINQDSIKFQATGCSGSRGEQLYSFEIELYEKVDAKASSYKINDREISVSLQKKKNDSNSNVWPRLTKASAKLPWLKADFDRMTFSEDDSDDEQKKSMFNKNFNEDMYKSLRQDSRKAKTKGFLDHRTNWLLFYNLFQFIAYFWVFTRLTMYLLTHGHLKNGYKVVENPIKLCQALTILETIHPLIGFTKGDYLVPFFQFLFRNLILFIVINFNRQIQTSPIVPCLLFVWSFVEIFRYPYYGIRLLNKENRAITWFRYTFWIVLYPLGAFIEGLIIYKSLDHYRSKGYFSITLPNRANFAFNFVLFLQIYLVLMPFDRRAMVAPPNLSIDKIFRRLLSSTEKLVEEKAIEDWKVHQFAQALTDMLNDVHKWANFPSSKQLKNYKERVDRLRQTVDPVKLEDQTFPQNVPKLRQVDLSLEKQQAEIPTSSISLSENEKQHNTLKRLERPNLNRQQQYIQSEEDKQDDIATSMRQTTKSLLHSAQRLNDIVKDDQKKLVEAENLIDTNTAKLHVQSRRLKHNAYNVSNCWIYLMLIAVLVTFIYLTLFMRMFGKRTKSIVYSTKDSKSSYGNNLINQSTINSTNITTTKSTDYISLLLNYANENHTDL
ncbi:unnamed protein product [Adineta ricciae]|uniref:Very-long-chain (3R)-3-hydroxyacyl-CoA dehydratase n=3 Tax=Adineta ricciae TaxID=249248 RepID=A0A814NE92_ADIRI|nr:unnamed protein product [Adineta ricciae]